jgi:hypothetical protein
MSTGKKVGIGIGSFFGLLIIAGAIIFVLITKAPATPPAPPPLPPGASAPSGVPSTPAPSLQQQVDAIQQKIKETQESGQPQEVKLTITEAEATTQLKKALPVTASGLVIKDGTIFFRPGQVLIQIGAEFQGITVYPNIAVTVIAKGGKATIDISSLELGAIPLPIGKEQLAGIVSDQFDKALVAAKDLNVTAVQVNTQSVTVTGMTKPK